MSGRASVAVILAFAFWPGASAQQRDAVATAPPGTATIAGTVVSDETPPRPIRRAIVSISGDVPAMRSAITDDDGRFTFTGLPAGRFSLSAIKTAFLTANYGATRPGRAGTTIAIARDERATVTLVMARGAVLTGVVRDSTGGPIAGVLVSAFNARTAVATGLTGQGAVATDDRGVYRLYGLMPGEYLIAATPRVTGAGEVGRWSTASLDAALLALQQRARPGSSGPAGPRSAAPIALPPAAGYAPTYYPGTPMQHDAVRVKVAAGEERAGLDFPVTAVPVASIEGAVSGDVQNLAATQVSIVAEGQRGISGGGTTPVLTDRPDATGRFRYTNVAPGRYTIMARVTPGPSPVTTTVAGGSGGGAIVSSSSVPAPQAPPGGYLFAIAEVDVNGQDIKGVALPLQPGGTIRGRVRFDATTLTPPADLFTWRVGAALIGGSWMSSSGGTTMGPALMSMPAVPFNSDGTFEVTNIAPGPKTFTATGPEMPQGWWLRSLEHDGKDLLDAPLVFKPGMHLTGVVLTISDRQTELSGRLQTAAGQPASDYFVIVFPADRTLWRVAARRVQTARPGTDGRFVVRGLPPGAYLMAALTDLEPNEWEDAGFLEQIAPAAIAIALGEGEKKTQDLKIGR